MVAQVAMSEEGEEEDQKSSERKRECGHHSNKRAFF